MNRSWPVLLQRPGRSTLEYISIARGGGECVRDRRAEGESQISGRKRWNLGRTGGCALWRGRTKGGPIAIEGTGLAVGNDAARRGGDDGDRRGYEARTRDDAEDSKVRGGCKSSCSNSRSRSRSNNSQP